MLRPDAARDVDNEGRATSSRDVLCSSSLRALFGAAFECVLLRSEGSITLEIPLDHLRLERRALLLLGRGSEHRAQPRKLRRRSRTHPFGGLGSATSDLHFTQSNGLLLRLPDLGGIPVLRRHELLF